MLLGVISDTHDNVDAVEHAVNQFRARRVETLIHCGDIVAPPTIAPFEGFEFHAVLGNNDGEIAGLTRTIEGLGNGSTLHGRFGTLEFDDISVAFTHGERLDMVEALARSGRFDYVCYGHHHEPEVRTVDGTTLLNPGALYSIAPIDDQSVAVIDTETDDVDFVAVV